MNRLQALALSIVSTVSLSVSGVSAAPKPLTFKTATASEVASVLCTRSDVNLEGCFDRYNGFLKHTNGNQTKTKAGVRSYVLSTVKITPRALDAQIAKALGTSYCSQKTEDCN